MEIYSMTLDVNIHLTINIHQNMIFQLYSVELETKTVTCLDAQHMAAATTIVAFFAGSEVCGSTIITAVQQNVFPLVYRLLGKWKSLNHVYFPFSSFVTLDITKFNEYMIKNTFFSCIEACHPLIFLVRNQEKSCWCLVRSVSHEWCGHSTSVYQGRGSPSW